VPRTLTLGDRELARIGLGTNRLTDTPLNRAFIADAVEAGVQMIDTAHIYTGGDSERTIGAALADDPPEVVVATKGGYRPGTGNPEALRAQLEQSFESLRTETIGLYYLHRVDPETALEDSLGLLKEYRDAGRIEHVGLSAVGVDEIERGRAVLPIAAVQNRYNLAERRYDDVVDFCEAEGIVFVPYYPLHGPEATPNQVKLAWLLKRSPATLPIPGSLSLEHLRENLAALGLELSDADYEELTARSA
jgi:aryl-alcohol dehydrogenase-like predicted oxidoreductase